MKWAPRQLTIPIVISFSLTGVSLALLYLVYRKEQEVKKANEERFLKKKLSKRKIKVPRQFIPAIIGRGGSSIQEIQCKSKTKIHIEKDVIDSPDRTCVIEGAEANIQLAQQMIDDIVANRPIIETYDFYIPEKAFRRVVGKCGETLHQIQITSGAKIVVDSTFIPRDPNADIRIILKGTAEQIANAVSQIEDKIHEEIKVRKESIESSISRLPREELSPRSMLINSIETGSTTGSPPREFWKGGLEVYVSAVVSPSQFWVQIIGSGTTALDKLVAEMTEYYNQEENQEIHVLRKVSVGQILASKFSVDERWYRAEILTVHEDGNCEVYFMDYGDREVVDPKNLFELRTDFLGLPLQAIECTLNDVWPRTNDWSPAACDIFIERTRWKVLTAKIRGFKERAVGCQSRGEALPIPCMDLYQKQDTDIGNTSVAKIVNIGLELIQEGFAKRGEPLSSSTSSTISLSANRSQDLPGFSSPVSTASQSKDVEPKTPLSSRTQANIEVIDLTETQKEIEEIDLVTPVKKESQPFIESEKRAQQQASVGPVMRNGSAAQFRQPTNGNSKTLPKNILPADYDSDESDDYDGFELG